MPLPRGSPSSYLSNLVVNSGVVTLLTMCLKWEFKEVFMNKIFPYCFLVLLFSCTTKKEIKTEEPQRQEESESAVAYVQSSSGTVRGTVTLQRADAGLIVQAKVRGLKPNSQFGFHVHEDGVCEGPDFETAGGHFNPTHQEHAGPHTLSRHMGDFGNLKSDADGGADAEFLIPLSKNLSVASFLNHAVIIHARPDDFSTQPSGGSGSRLACGVIGRENG